VKDATTRQGWHLATRHDNVSAGALLMSFFVGLLLFVVVVGILDAKLPWPPRRTPRARP
jgi:hypothetical protein